MKRAILRLLAAILPAAVWAQAPASVRSGPLTVGETFTLLSKILGEARPINVYVPSGDVDPRVRQLVQLTRQFADALAYDAPRCVHFAICSSPEDSRVHGFPATLAEPAATNGGT